MEKTSSCKKNTPAMIKIIFYVIVISLILLPQGNAQESSAPINNATENPGGIIPGSNIYIAIFLVEVIVICIVIYYIYRKLKARKANKATVKQIDSKIQVPVTATKSAATKNTPDQIYLVDKKRIYELLRQEH